MCKKTDFACAWRRQDGYKQKKKPFEKDFFSFVAPTGIEPVYHALLHVLNVNRCPLPVRVAATTMERYGYIGSGRMIVCVIVRVR